MNIERLKTCQSSLYQLAIDDTAVGTEINTPKAFGESVVQCLTGLTDVTFINVLNKFEELNTYNRMVELSGALNTLAVSLSE
jgi:fumarate hydratase class II